MMTAMLLALWVQNAGFTLRIQAVDSGWLPLAGVSFKVQSVGSCDRPPLASDLVRAHFHRLSGACGRKVVGVRVPPSAPTNKIGDLAPGIGPVSSLPERAIRFVGR
jgi:hypothetical protein